MDAVILRLDKDYAVMKLSDKSITLLPRKLLDPDAIEGDTVEIRLVRRTSVPA